MKARKTQYWTYLIVPSFLMGAISPAFSQMMPGQVITQTVGNKGSVTTNRNFMETDSEQFFSFSLSTDEQRIRDKDKRKSGKKRRNKKGNKGNKNKRAQRNKNKGLREVGK